MSIKDELTPHIDYITNEISAMKMFDKERVKLLLLLWFSQTVEEIYSKRAESMAGENINNQRAIETGSLSKKDKQFLAEQNIITREQRKENNRISTMGKNIKEHIQLRQFLCAKFGKKEFISLMQEADNFEIDISGLLKGQGIKTGTN